MAYYIIKLLISAVLIVAISEVSKRFTVAGAVLASLPIISVLAMVWLYVDTRSVEKVAQLSMDVFWLVIPSLILFIALPLLLRKGMAFAPALLIAMAATVCGYFVMLKVLQWVGSSA